MEEIPEFKFKTVEDVINWIEEERARRKNSANSDDKKKDWIPVDRQVFIDDFSWLLDDTIDEDDAEK